MIGMVTAGQEKIVSFKGSLFVHELEHTLVGYLHDCWLSANLKSNLHLARLNIACE